MGDADALGLIEGWWSVLGSEAPFTAQDGYAVIVPNQKLVSKNIINLSVLDTRAIKITANLKIWPDSRSVAATDLQTAASALDTHR